MDYCRQWVLELGNNRATYGGHLANDLRFVFHNGWRQSGKTLNALLGLWKVDSLFSNKLAFAYMDNDQLIRYFELVVLYTIGYIMLTISTNNGRMEFQVVFGRESLDIMTSAMLIVTFLILFVKFCLGLSLSGRHRPHHNNINPSVRSLHWSFLVGFRFGFFVLPPGVTILESVRANHEFDGDFRTALVLPQQEQEFARLDQHFQRNHDCTVPRVVKNLSLPYFQSKLIQHFDIAFKGNEIQWPGRCNQQEQVPI